jgi:sec-independent protein translocase protein TatC
MAFFLPALKPSERKWVIPTFCVAVALFIFGAVFCYAVILTTAFQWLLGQTSDFANVFANASDYVGLIMLFEVAFGAAFELPLVVFYLLIFNIIKYKKLRKSWRVVYIVLLVFCAVVTPDSSPVTMALMFVAMAALYEISLFAARIVLRKRIKNNQEASDGETGDGDEDDDD